MRDNVLIGVFLSQKKRPGKFIRELVETFGTRKAFVFEVLEEDSKRFLITFNISKVDKNDRLKEFRERFKNTIQLHRNKDYNVLYTINSLNKLVEEQNGEKDENYVVDWSDYKNCCLLSNKDGKLRKLGLKLHDIFEL